MKTLKLIFALGLAAALFVGCSKSDTTTNSTSTSNSSNTKASSSPASTPSTTNSSAKTDSSTASSSGDNNTFTHKEGGIQFTLPAGWKSKEQGDAMTVSTADDALQVVLWVPQGDDFDKAVKDLDGELGKVIKNPKITTPGHETEHNGMKAYAAAGTGEVEGSTIAWEVDILQAKKPVFILSFAAPQQFSSHESEYKQLLGSIKKAE
ncbi:MAG: hypothetical protein DMF68_21585 [Acidobacteria bacterium]|nr:MAG: hypothetical protein DMF68_21585 [Acidobacteriota bacterium]